MKEFNFEAVMHVLFVMVVFALGMAVCVMGIGITMTGIPCLAFILFSNEDLITMVVYYLVSVAFAGSISVLIGPIVALMTVWMRARLKVNIDSVEKQIAHYAGLLGCLSTPVFIVLIHGGVSEEVTNYLPYMIAYLVGIYWVVRTVTGWLTDWYVRNFVVLWQPEHLTELNA